MASAFKKEIVEKMTALIVAAFGLVAALAWNGAIQAFFMKFFGSPDGLLPMLIYAVVITVIAVAVIMVMSKISEKVK